MADNTALILGASGKVGRHSAQAFADAGWQLRFYNRKQDDMAAAASGVDVIVNGLNPPNYHDWKRIIPDITAQVIAAARSSGATVVLPGNVYHFGNMGGVWSENTVPNPVSRKGEIRLAMERAYQDSGVQTLVLRAGNFIDPNRQGCVMSQVYLSGIKRGKLTVPGDLDVRQALCYLPDWARAAAALAGMRSELAQFEDIPFPGQTLTAQQMKAELESILGRSLDFVSFPWWLMQATSPVWELARELLEMRYLWNTDHALCDKRFRSLLPQFQASELKEVLRSAVPPALL